MRDDRARRRVTPGALDDAVDLRGEAVDAPGLDRLDRALADHVGGRELDGAQRGGLPESASSEISMPGAIAPPRYSPLADTASNVVAVPKSTTIVGPP